MNNVSVVKGTRWVLSVLCVTTILLFLRVNRTVTDQQSNNNLIERDDPVPMSAEHKQQQQQLPLVVDATSSSGKERLGTAEVTSSSSIAMGTAGASDKTTVTTNVSFTVSNTIPIVADNKADKTTTTTETKTSEKTTTTSDTQATDKPTTTPPRKRLNILVMYPDDWRHDSLGCAGTQPVLTPFLDSLAQQGVRFTHNCVTTSICWVSRATHFTGQYLSRHKSSDLTNPPFYQHWNESYPYLLQKAGYFAGHVGKWQYSNYTWVEEQYNWTRLHEGYHWFDQWSPNGTISVHAADVATSEAIQFLRERPKDRPFSLSVAYYPPKAIGSSSMQWTPKNETLKLYENMTIPEPYNWNASWHLLPAFLRDNEARVRWKQRFGNYTLYQNSVKAYYAMITEVDKACENLVNELKQQNILDDTLIIFTVDNGFFLGEHGLAGKWFPYQESIRVPLIIRDPRMPKDKIGTLDDSFTLNVDLATTILGAANVAPSSVMQGRDMSDLYLQNPKMGKETWRKEFFYEHMSMGRDYIPASTALVRKDFKYFYYSEWNVEQLYDLKNDPYENHDLSNRTEYAELMKEMKKRHDELKAEAL